MRHGSSTTLRVLVIGAGDVGKSAITVRFLTRRFIGEYNSNIDLLYRSTVRLDDTAVDVELLDCSSNKDESTFPTDGQMRWADAFIIVYSICDRCSFYRAKQLITQARKLQSYVPILLIANKRDLEDYRVVEVTEGHEVALQNGCQFHEVSAAETHFNINIAFHSLLREAKITHNQRTSSLKRRKSSLISVSKKLGAMFGKISKDSQQDGEKKRGSI